MTKAPIKLYNLKYILIGLAETIQHAPQFVRWNGRVYQRLKNDNVYQEVKVIDLSSVKER